MANEFLKAEKFASVAVTMLERELVLGRLVWTNHGIDFSGAKGDAVTLRIPARTTAREYDWRNDRSATITTDSLVEDSVNVNLNHDIYSAVAVTDEELTLDVESFGAQILDPQVRAVATDIDMRIASMIESAPYPTDATGTVTVEAGATWDGVVEARRLLNVNEVPNSNRVLLVGSNFEAALLKDDKFTDVDRSGSSSALRDATLGRLGGFTIVTSTAINPDSAYAFVPSAFLVATRAPAIPAGAPYGAGASFAGYAMRWVRDYESQRLQDRSVVSTFAGFNIMLDQVAPGNTSDPKVLKRAVKLELAPLG